MFSFQKLKIIILNTELIKFDTSELKPTGKSLDFKLIFWDINEFLLSFLFLGLKGL